MVHPDGSDLQARLEVLQTLEVVGDVEDLVRLGPWRKHALNSLVIIRRLHNLTRFGGEPVIQESRHFLDCCGSILF